MRLAHNAAKFRRTTTFNRFANRQYLKGTECTCTRWNILQRPCGHKRIRRKILREISKDNSQWHVAHKPTHLVCRHILDIYIHDSSVPQWIIIHLRNNPQRPIAPITTSFLVPIIQPAKITVIAKSKQGKRRLRSFRQNCNVLIISHHITHAMSTPGKHNEQHHKYNPIYHNQLVKAKRVRYNGTNGETPLWRCSFYRPFRCFLLLSSIRKALQRR